MPGTDAREAAAMVLGELPDLPHLVELPGRGVGADMVGRTGGLLAGLHVDLQPSGWRLVDRPGLDERRARSYLAHDLDHLEEAADGFAGPVKVQACGPWTAAAALRLPRGEPVLSDAGALRDVIGSLTEGLRTHVADLRHRVPGGEPVVQLDEPSLPSVLHGAIRSTSGARSYAPVVEATAQSVLASLIDALEVPVVVHCCARRPPVALLHRAGAAGLSLDLTVVSQEIDDEVGAAVEAGVALLAGLVPAVLARGEPSRGETLSDPAATVEPVRRLWHRLGLAPEALRSVVVTPTCGMAGADPGHVVAALRLARDGARQLADDPEG